ncbi:hypothetical protein [Streptomyces antimicrobicus]|uniref:ATP/GTP-binding protein n=1 Tax=Streptomyces antimicrobicus TaxID=2883108 RepID=A0ABS8BBG9_9ACTN|nr:hypothetical protein [Streptomyces antimicrobicus]MCB5181876.1 hypothetical protein [Streptomyces antimicrobicus]
MIRLPSTHAAITAPLPASSTAFPGIPIGRSLLDGRPFHLSPVMADDAILPSTNVLGLGGLGSGKSSTGKARMLREIRDHGHQAVVIDPFGEDGANGEWRPVVQALGGQVIKAGSFTLNPVSQLFPAPVREQLVRSLILAVEPDALTHKATHALQHALNHPKGTTLGGLVDALVTPEDGRWPAERLAEWGVGAAIALSRYTEGPLTGLFDGPDAGLPPTDLPIVSFDFTGLDRNSPAIPSLMAAVTCWAEHVWLPSSTATHRHLVLEEAWQVLLSPATAELIQRQVKNSRKAALSMTVLMHTLSDLGDGRARDLARLCEIAHVGRLGPEEAAIVGALLGLPQWAVDMIPTLGPGQAVWRIGPHYVDIVQTVLSEEEAALTDTSSRRRQAQQGHAVAAGETTTPEPADDEELTEDDEGLTEDDDEPTEEQPAHRAEDGDEPGDAPRAEDEEEGEWAWEMPPGVIDARHYDVLQAAREGRCSEAAHMAAIGEREDINAYGINSDQAVSWLATRAQVAELCGEPSKAVQLRATVTRMGKNPDWYQQADGPGTAWYSGPQPTAPEQPPAQAPAPPVQRRRAWPYVAAIAALSITIAGVWQYAAAEERRQELAARAAAYKGRSGAELNIDGVSADLVAHWSRDRDRVTIELRTFFDRNARYLRVDAGGKSASTVPENGWFPKAPEVVVPVADPLADVTVRVAIGGRDWREGVQAPSRTVRLSPTGTAVDAETGQRLKSDLG